MIASKMVPARQESSGDEIFQLQMELTELRKRLKVLDSGAEKSELLDLLKERDGELEGKNRQLKLLNDKFRQITDGLRQIEDERRELRASHAKLEADKKKVDRHLDVREREVVTIAQRCAALEEKIQESVPLRVAHQKLQREKEALEEELRRLGDDLGQLADLKNELSASRAAETDALAKAKELEEQSKANSDSLIATISKLEREKFDCEEAQKELGEEIVKLKASREEERRENRAAMDRLREEIRCGKEKVGELEERLKEYGSTISALRKEGASMKESHAAASKQTEAEHTTALADLGSKHDDALKDMREENEEKAKDFRSQLEERDVSVATLTKDLSSERQTVEDLKSQVAAGQSEGSARTSQHAAEIEKLSTEKSSLLDQLEARGDEVNSLRSSLTEADGRNSALSEEATRLRDRIKELEGEVSSKAEVEEQLYRVRRTVEQLRDENSKMEEETSDEITNLRQDLEDAWFSKAEVEKELNGKIKSLQEEKDAREEDVSRKVSDCQSLESDIATLKSSIEQLVQQNAQMEEESEQNETKFRQELDSEKARSVQLEKDLNGRFHALEEEKTGLEKDLKEKLRESRSLVGSLRIDLAKREEDFSSLVAESAKVETGLMKEMDSFVTNIQTLDGQLEEANATIARRDAQIDELENVTLNNARQSIASLEAKISGLTMKISESELEAAEIVADLEAQIEAKRAECNRLQLRVTKTKDFELLLTQQRTARSQVNELLSEVRKLESSRDQANVEQSRIIAELELEIDGEREQVGKLRSEYEELQLTLDRARGQITSDAGTMEKMQTLLNDRTKLLGDMVIQNKELEADLLEARAIVADLQAESDRYLQLKDAADLQRDQIKTELDQKEDHYLDAIHQERQVRDKVENDLATARAALHRYRQDIKDMDDLHKENTALKDKVKRQEAYLKRKLEKEKVSRVVATKGPGKTSRYSSGSQGGGGGGGASLGTSRNQRVPLSENSDFGVLPAASSSGSYPDDELDAILQDDV